MKILSIKLVKFDGMSLNDVTVFEMEVVSRITLILGRNGSGKSRLMGQLNPFSIQKKDYADDGSKTFKFELNGTVYVLYSYMSGSSVKNTLTNLTTGEVIHKDVNPSYHNQYMADLTGWSNELHQLFCRSEHQLTKMKTGDRKYWFGKLSESDLAYAFKFYNKLKEDHRDLVGAERSLKNEISELSLRVSESAAAYDQIKASLQDLDDLYKRLSDRRRALELDPGYMAGFNEDALIAKYEALGEKATQFIKMDGEPIPELEVADEWQLVHAIGALESSLNAALDKLMALKQTVNDAESDQCPIEDLMSWIADAHDNLESIKSSFMHEPVLTSTKRYYTDYDTLLTKAMAVTEYSESTTILTHDAIEALRVNIGNVNGNIYKCDVFIGHADKHIQHFDTADKTECPECKHTFVAGYNADNIVELKAKREEAYQALARYRIDLAALQLELAQTMERVQKRDAYLQELAKVRRDNPVDFLILSEVGKNDLIGTIMSLREDWKLWDQLKTLERAKAELDQRLANASKHSPDALRELHAQISELESRVDVCRVDKDIAQRQLDTIRTYRETQARFTALKNELAIYYQDVERAELGLLISCEYDDVSEEMTRIGALFEETRSRFVLMDDTRIQLERLRKRLDDVSAEREVAAALVQAMGPEEGLLAKHLYRSITRVTEEMTNITRKVWGYPITIYPCDIENGELNYKFPFNVKDKVKRSPDVSDSSTGQAKMFDLAFNLTIYNVLNLKGYPIFLDEPFSGFDEEHQDTNIKFINNKLEMGEYSQMFMVSHDPEIHFQLNHAEYVVIDGNGISLPKEYNKHVTIQ